MAFYVEEFPLQLVPQIKRKSKFSTRKEGFFENRHDPLVAVAATAVAVIVYCQW